MPASLQTLRALAIITALAPVPLLAQITTTATFDAGTNVGGWTYGRGMVEGTGGNPGGYFHTNDIDTFAPEFRTTGASAFTGDYRTRRVTSLGVDLILNHVDFSAAGRPLSLVLHSDNGTPGNTSDDWGAYTLGAQNIPLVGEGWRSYTFAVPSAATALPAGWTFISFGDNSPANPTWPALVSRVSRVEFFYGNPEFFFIFQVWDTGADNARITEIGAPTPCPPDTNHDGEVNANDISAYLNAWYADITGGTVVADFDASGETDANDISAFINAWYAAVVNGGVC